MRDYINRLSRGKNIYQIPELSISPDTLDYNATCGEVNEAFFRISSDVPVKGIVYVYEKYIRLKTETFYGKDNVIEFVVDATDLEANSQIDGNFIVVCEGGEKEYPFTIHLVEKYINTSLSQASNLFHFTNLVKLHREEAGTIFKSDDFKKIFLKNDVHLLSLYDALYDEKHIDSSMEEFLIAVRKKNAVTFSVKEKERIYEATNSNEKDIIVIEKSDWGYIKLDVETDSEFISLSHNRISSDDFTGDMFELEYVIDVTKLHAGRNYGRITVKSHNQSINVDVCVNNREMWPDKESEDYQQRKEIKNAKAVLTSEYLKFRMKKIRKESWISHSEQTITRILGLGIKNHFFEIAQAQLFLMSGRVEEGKWILDNLKSDIFENINSDVELYCYYLYVSTLAIGDGNYTKEVTRQVRNYYENGHDSFFILWILIYLGNETESNKSIRLVRIKDEFEAGCVSPIMYIEAINIFNSCPVLLRVLDNFELQVLNFGYKNECISDRLAIQAAEVMGRERQITPEGMRILKSLYKTFDDDEILKALVTQMVRNQITGKESFEIYEKAILRGLRITRLYEFYIESMDKDVKRQIPKMVLMYFAYDNSLSVINKSFIYANVITNKSKIKDVYATYQKNIELFTYEQLKCGNVNDYLLVLYRNVLSSNMITEDTVKFIKSLRFMYKVSCYDSSVKRVIVSHQEFNEKQIYEPVDGKSYIFMYSQSATVAFLCEDGIVRKDSIVYEIEKVYADEKELTDILSAKESEFGDYESAGMMINMIYQIRKKEIFSADVLELYKKVKQLKEISNDYEIKLNSWMIEFYNSYYALDDFWHEYPYVNTDNLCSMDVSRLTEILINHGMYSQAYELICQYDYIGVGCPKLLKLVDYYLSNISCEYNRNISDICGYIFSHKIYNETVLKYMVQYYNGTNDAMYNLWKSCVNFCISVEDLSKRLIAQMLFTGVHSGRLTEVFSDYYKKRPDLLIVKAYVSYNSQLYLVKNKKPNDIVFKVIEDCIKDDVGIPDCCYIAWLMDVSKKTADLKENQKKLELVKDILYMLCREDKIFSFYKRFENVIKLPYNCVGITVVEYIANPDSKVSINYSINDEDECCEVCHNTDCGIFTFRFNLFYGDRVKYQFVVNNAGIEIKTDYYSLDYSEINQSDNTNRYDAINDCLASRELRDMVTLKKLKFGYVVEDYVTKQLFKPMK